MLQSVSCRGRQRRCRGPSRSVSCRFCGCSPPIRSKPGREAHFEEPVVAGGLPFGRAIVVSEPAAIRRVLLDNAGNYEKDWMQRRILSAGLADGLLSAEGHQWRVQRRALAPLFSTPQRHELLRRGHRRGARPWSSG